MLNTIQLSKLTKIEKMQLAYVAGYRVKEIIQNRKYIIEGADGWCDNNFRNMDEILKLIQPDLYKIRYKIVA